MKVLNLQESFADDQLAEAIGKLRAFASAAPDIPSTWVRLAELLEQSAAVSEASEAWMMAHRLVPNSPRILAALERLGVESDRLQAPAPAHVPGGGSDPDPNAATSRPDSGRPELIDIDVLIADLQHGRAHGFAAPPDADTPDVEHQEEEELATETLAGIFESQSLFAEAISMYELLADREENAEKAETLRARANDLRTRNAQPD